MRKNIFLKVSYSLVFAEKLERKKQLNKNNNLKFIINLKYYFYFMFYM